MRYERLEMLRTCRDIADDWHTRFGRKGALQLVQERLTKHRDKLVRRNWFTIRKLIELKGAK